MKMNFGKLGLLALIAFVLTVPVVTSAQPGSQPQVNESGEVKPPTPRDGIYDRDIIQDRLILPYDHIREADVFWEKRIWRVLDVREKMNKPFVYPKAPFINILLDAADRGDITLYSTIDDEFTNSLTVDEVNSIGGTVDTIITFDPETFEEVIEVVTNDLNWEDIKRFRIKEVWFFDEETSTLQVRILGIAPLQEKYDDNGNFLYEFPMFWAYYPELREVLARHESFNPLNDAMRMSWEDIFEMRFFASYIMKESNVYDRRIRDYKAGLDILLEADKIHNEIFNFEHDLWVY
jgi:gliding motility associated protien GldN